MSDYLWKEVNLHEVYRLLFQPLKDSPTFDTKGEPTVILRLSESSPKPEDLVVKVCTTPMPGRGRLEYSDE